jgi:hypothetical protein
MILLVAVSTTADGSSPLQVHLSTTSWSLARRVLLHVRLVRLVVSWTGTSRVVALVDFGIGVTQFDGNVSLELIFESDGLNATDSFYDLNLCTS